MLLKLRKSQKEKSTEVNADEKEREIKSNSKRSSWYRKEHQQFSQA